MTGGNIASAVIDVNDTVPKVTAMSSVAAKIPRYVALDLMRGLAAVAVLIYHTGYMLGSFAPNMGKGYLAVDFFFVLSGFVIAANYHVSVRPSITWPAFLSVRLSRLWPLFILSTLLGVFVVVMKLNRDYGYLDTPGILGALALNGAMLPSVVQAYGVDRLFVFNGASWSVFFELVINIIFFAALRRLSLKTLAWLAGIFAGALMFVAHAHGNLDGGWSVATFYVGAARVLYGFVSGMVVYSVSRKLKFRLHGLLSAAVILCLCLALFVSGDWLVECALVILGFPLLVLLASRSDLTGLTALVGGRLGDISYSVYLLQTPIMIFVAGACQVLVGRKVAEFAPVSGLAFVIAMLGISYLSWRFFELPTRDYLRSLFRSREHRHVFKS